MENGRMEEFSNVQSVKNFSASVKTCLSNKFIDETIVDSTKNMLSVKTITTQPEVCSRYNGTCLNGDTVNGSISSCEYETDEFEPELSSCSNTENNESQHDSSHCTFTTDSIAENLHNELLHRLSINSSVDCSISKAEEENINKNCSYSETKSEPPHQKSPEITYVSYESELQMANIMSLIQKDLSEPYSIYTYRYFIHNWPHLCFLAFHGNKSVGAIVCKLDMHRKVVKRGYIAMLAVDENYRKLKIGSNLVLKAIRAMVADGADEVVLETEITNRPALGLYENLGFVRDKRLFRYYLNGVDALRLKLWLR